ncbi:MAG: hypothetical protein IJ193_07595, partial [Bacilli bacterium]|nr:hypothetical protein [Bacilli bacterium]
KAKKSRIVLDIGETTNGISNSLEDTSPLNEVVEAVKKEEVIDPVANLISNVAKNKTTPKEEKEEKKNIELKGISQEEINGVISKEESVTEEKPSVEEPKIPIVEKEEKETVKEDAGIQVRKPLTDIVTENENIDEVEEKEEANVSEESTDENFEKTEQLEIEDVTEQLEVIDSKTEQLEVIEDEVEQLETEDEIEERLSHTSPLESVQNIVQEIENNPDIESELEKTHDYDVFEPYKKKEEIRLTQSDTTNNNSKPKAEKAPREKIDLKKSWKKAVHYNYSSRIATLCGIILIFFILFVIFLFKAFGYEMGGSSTYSEYTTNDYFVCGDSTNENCLPKDREYISDNIDHINVKFTYDAKYSSSVSFDANYYVAARVRIFDGMNRSRLKYTKEDLIVERTPLMIGGEVINFSSDAFVDYNTFKQVVMDYINDNQEDVSAQLEVALYLETDDVARKISYINIPLTEDSFNITVSNLDNQNQLVVFNTVDSTIDPFYIFIAIICVLMDLLLFLYLYNFVSMINHLESKYTIRLRRILKLYDKYIVNAHQEYIIPEDARVIDVDRIEELVDARNALNKPIIYDKINNIKSKFYVEDNNIVYCYTLKDDE